MKLSVLELLENDILTNDIIQMIIRISFLFNRFEVICLPPPGIGKALHLKKLENSQVNDLVIDFGGPLWGSPMLHINVPCH